MVRALGVSLALALAAGCVRSEPNPFEPPAGAHAQPKSAALEPDPGAPAEPEDGGESLAWQPETRSPRPSADPAQADLARLCEGRDAAMDAVAALMADRTLAGQPPLTPADIHFSLRAQGSPYVWVRAWSLDGEQLQAADVQARAGRWLGSFDDGGSRRCGFALRSTDGREVIYALAADALAELEPLPTRARAGSWLSVRAKLLVPATEAKVVVLGPRGAPKPLPSSLSGSIVRATFSADAPGVWSVQVLASVEGGPRPVAEAVISVGVEPPRALTGRAAPGESAQSGASNDADAMFAMLNAARRSERVRELTRDARLDRLAHEHALAMQTARRLGHDVGGGTASDRLRVRGIDFRAAGENVARAATLTRAHRALWASPSHRGNLLDARFASAGIGVARDPDGSVWVCEMFATF